jgi:hypothetical protein
MFVFARIGSLGLDHGEYHRVHCTEKNSTSLTNGVDGVADGKTGSQLDDFGFFSPLDLIRAKFSTRGASAQVTGLSLSLAASYVLCIDCEQTQGLLPPRGLCSGQLLRRVDRDRYRLRAFGRQDRVWG